MSFKNNLSVLFAWGIAVILSYTFLIPPVRLDGSLLDGPPSFSMEAHNLGADQQFSLIEAIVLIAMSKMAEDPMIDYSIATIRKLGNWKGDIFVLTDRKACFTDAARNYDVKFIEIPSISSLIRIKALKPKLMTFLPKHINRCLQHTYDVCQSHPERRGLFEHQ
jgi:hypothetical protein